MSVIAQDGALAGVTMRVVDDLRGLAAAILELEPAADDSRDADADADRRDATAEDAAADEPPVVPKPPEP